MDPSSRARKPGRRRPLVAPLAAALMGLVALIGRPDPAEAQIVRSTGPRAGIPEPAGPAPPIELDQPNAPVPQPPAPGGVLQIPAEAIPPPPILPEDAQPLPPALPANRELTPGAIIRAVDSPEQDIELYVNRSKLFRLEQELSSDTLVSYDNERVVNVQFLTDPEAPEAKLRFINLFGVGFGFATVTLIDQERDIIQTLKVHVTIDEEDLADRINRLFPGADILVSQVAQNVILEGEVPNPKMMADILELVQSEMRLSGQANVGSLTGSVYGSMGNATGATGGAGGGGGMGGGAAPNMSMNSMNVPGGLATQSAAQPGLAIINRVRVPGPRQVLLKVKIAEINRTAMRQLGVDWQRVTAGDVLGSTIGQAGQISNVPGVTDLTEATKLFGIFDESQFSLYLNALRRNDLARILAEPTLVTLDGQPAQFLAGGEFPYPVAQIGGGGSVPSITIEFREFGAVLEFLPFIMEDDLIRLDVEPNFSELNFATGTSVLGTSVPGLNVRSARTVVQLRRGQSLAIAGLFSTRTRGRTDRIPLLGDFPLIGPLFSRNEIQTEETELVVFVTPELVEPVDKQAGPGPGEDYLEPNDYEFYFLGRLEGRTGHPHRATLQYLDPLEIMKHFQSEDHWVVGPHGFAD